MLERLKYVEDLVKEWVDQLKELSKIAKSEPQAAYAAFTSGFRHKLTYFLRTIPNLEEVLKPIDDVIDNSFIPAITEGHVLSQDERKLFSLPVKLGGMGIPIFTETCTVEYQNSLRATETTRSKIVSQETSFILDRRSENAIDAEIRKQREERNEAFLQDLRQRMSKEKLRGNDIAQMKGGSSWLTALPLKDEGYTLNKREFFDALAIRYSWELKRLPTHCVCKKKFDMEHAMSCKNGGYVIRRHNRLRDLFGELLDQVASEVLIEPPLEPLTGELLPSGTKTADDARLDIAARGFWQQYEMAYFDVKVFNPYAKSYMSQNLEAAFKMGENSKKRAYNTRVIRIEHGTFTPLVFSSCGGNGFETGAFISKLTEKLAEKKDLAESVVSNYIRTKVSFELVRSQVACIRGSRKLRKMRIDAGEMEMVTTTANIRD